MAEGVGAFMVCAALISLSGITGWFERVMNRIPMAIASALLAGVLTRFGLQGFTAAQTALPLVTLMLVTYLAGKRWVPRYAVPITLLVAIVYVANYQGFTGTSVSFYPVVPVLTVPSFTWAAAVSLALPLFVVTMASQNLPGVAAIQAAGYGRKSAADAGMPISKVITLTGLATLVLAPFGAFALNLSAITAAICMGEEAHPNPKRRYNGRCVLWGDLRTDRHFWRGHHRCVDLFPQRACSGDCRAGPAGHDWRRAGHCRERRHLSRSRHHHFSGHAQRPANSRSWLGLLGGGGRRVGGICATVRETGDFIKLIVRRIKFTSTSHEHLIYRRPA